MPDVMLPLHVLSRTAQVLFQQERCSCKLEQLGIRRDAARLMAESTGCHGMYVPASA